MRLLNQARRIIIVLNCNFVNCSEATKSSEVVNPSEALNTAATHLNPASPTKKTIRGRVTLQLATDDPNHFPFP